MLETGLFFLLSWSAFLSAEAAGLTGQCFVLQTGCVATCVSPRTTHTHTRTHTHTHTHTHPLPWPSRRWNEIFHCRFVSHPSWVPCGGEKKSFIYITAQPEVSKLPFPLLSLLVRKGMLKSMNDWCLKVMDDFIMGVSAQSVKGRPPAAKNRVVAFLWLLTVMPT